MYKIAIQGDTSGSYHSFAAKKYFDDDCELVDADNFDGVFRLVEDGEVDYGVVAIENSIFGTIRGVYDLLFAKEDIGIVGEAYVKLQHVLAGVSGASEESIKTVVTQNEALLACGEWFKKHGNLKWESASDTAKSLKIVKERNDKNVAGIGAKVACQDLGLEILNESIADNPDTDTRFVVIKKIDNQAVDKDANKASVLLKIANQGKGGLVEILQVLARQGINMSKIESRPLPKRKWEYMFYIDMEIQNANHLMTLEDELQMVGASIRILGLYQRSSQIFSTS